MHEIVSIGMASWRKVVRYVRANCRGETRRMSAVSTDAMKHAVPAALSQLNSNTAAYGAGFGVTGGMRVIALCSPGTSRPFNTVPLFATNAGRRLSLNRLRLALIDGAPHTTTHPTSNIYGSQPINTSAAERRR